MCPTFPHLLHQNFSAWYRSHQIFSNSMGRNVVQWPDVEERHPVFSVGEARYTAIPVKADIPDLKIAGADCLVTVLSAQRADLEGEQWLEHCKQDFRNVLEDVWTVDFLDGLTISSDWRPSSALVAKIKGRTAWHAIVLGLDLPVSTSSTIFKRLSSSLTRRRMVRTRCQRTCSVKCTVYMMTSKVHLWCLSSQCPRITGMFNDPYLCDVI